MLLFVYLICLGLLRIFTTTKYVIGNYLECDAEVYDSNDNLVAQSRQMALQIPFGKDPIHSKI